MSIQYLNEFGSRAKIEVDGVKVELFVDSGTSCNVINKSYIAGTFQLDIFKI